MHNVEWHRDLLINLSIGQASDEPLADGASLVLEFRDKKEQAFEIDLTRAKDRCGK